MEISLFTLAAIVVAIFLLYKWATQNHDYFLEKPIPSMKPNLIFGNTTKMFYRMSSLNNFVTSMYNKFPDAKVSGLFEFRMPFYIIRDPECLKQMAVKDFDYFVDHRPVVIDDGFKPGDSLFGNSLFALRGQKWRDMRAALSPAFTGSKMRQMFELVSECGENMAEFFLKETTSNGKLVHEMKDIFSRFANDVIATTAFGLKVDSLEDRENTFYVMGKKLINFNTAKVLMKMICFQICPKLMLRMGIDFMDGDLTKYFKEMIAETMATRDKQGIVRPDMINMLMQMKKGSLTHQNDEKGTAEIDGFATVEESQVGKSIVTRKWSDNELFAQCFLFFLAGFDTTSTCLSFLSYELMINPDVQQKLYEEVLETNESLNGKQLTYESLQKMTYMDMVVSETLRKWPPAPVVDRYCVKDYNFDDGEGLKFKIEKGKMFWIPIQGLHQDPKYFPNPEKFDPERFSEENRGNINLSAYIPFGIGPRNCIGSRFALMEVKVVIYYLLLHFKFVQNEKSQVPVKLGNSFAGLQSENGIWMEFVPRKLNADE